MVTWYQILFGTRASSSSTTPPSSSRPRGTVAHLVFSRFLLPAGLSTSRTDRGFLHPFSCRFHSSLMVAPPSSTQDLRDAEVLPAQGCHSPARQRPGEEKVRSNSMHRRFPLARRKELLEQVPSRRRSLAYLPHDGIRSRDKSAEPGEDPALHELRVEGHRYPSDVKCV